jgi:hypothetical protein
MEIRPQLGGIVGCIIPKPTNIEFGFLEIAVACKIFKRNTSDTAFFNVPILH